MLCRKIILFLLLFSVSCTQPKNKLRGFYFWKSELTFSASEKSAISQLKLDKLYLHFFDVLSDKASGRPVPAAIIKFSKDSFPKLQIVPVIFLENDVLRNINDSACHLLASKLLQLTNDICSYQNITFSELQIDCDWTEKTKLNYFKTLSFLKKLIPTNVLLSVTIRLHQVKYLHTTGIPPADRGMLMFYNMGDINPGAAGNSILNIKEAGKYLQELEEYPLSLDVALPVYSWSVVFRNRKPIEIIHRDGMDELSGITQLKRAGENIFIAQSGFFYKTVYIQQGDLIKVEDVRFSELQQAAKVLYEKLKIENRTIIFFDLDEKNFKRISIPEMETVYRIFN